ncbi:unnamed protein product, partial [Discosporangium mesarthrocarpum]
KVHERGLETDFLLVILRDLLPKRPDLRVVLMSATLQARERERERTCFKKGLEMADLFMKYFNCPVVTVPGRTFPVQVTYLDHMEQIVKGNNKALSQMPRTSGGNFIAAASSGRGGGHSDSQGRGHAPLGGAAPGSSRGNDSHEDGEDGNPAPRFDPLTGEPLPDYLKGKKGMETTDEGGGRGKKQGGQRGAVETETMVSPRCMDKVNLDTIVQIIEHIMSSKGASDRGAIPGSQAVKGGKRGRGQQGAGTWVEGGDPPLGAILVFLPGFAEIDQLVNLLQSHRWIKESTKVFPLHSSLTSAEQRSVFQRMPPGVRKIVVSTNIAETSVTIDDCTHVIDSGRVREMRYDPVTRISSLVEVWISKASASQRAGRAGRVRPGQCWRMYPEQFHTAHMPEHTLAEMLRTPLEELVLQV